MGFRQRVLFQRESGQQSVSASDRDAGPERTTEPLAVGRLEDIGHPLLAETVTYWRSLRVDGQTPARADIDPARIKNLLPNLIIAEILDDATRFRFRLAGTRIISAYDLTGTFLTAGDDPYDNHLAHIYGLAAREPAGIYCLTQYGYQSRIGARSIERVLLPLRGKADGPDMLLVCQGRPEDRPKLTLDESAPNLIDANDIRIQTLFALPPENLSQWPGV